MKAIALYKHAKHRSKAHNGVFHHSTSASLIFSHGNQSHYTKLESYPISMASSSTPTPISNPLTGLIISEKLSTVNHALWKMQALAVIRGASLEGYLTGESPASASTNKSTDSDGKDKEIPNPAF
jgi:hypothetical protein